jgi:geranylgeranyl reductase family protein
MESCDVLIVGGGPAGSSCAWRLAHFGLDVLVMDRKDFPRDKPCAGWITPALIEELQLDLDDYRRDRVLEPITGFSVGLMDGPEVETQYGKPISYGIRRCEFDHYLLQRSGARLRLGEPAQTFERVGGQWVINGTIQARMLVGAGGHFCPVARQLGAKSRGGEPVVAAQEIEVEVPEEDFRCCPVKPGVPYLSFCRDLNGYGWYFRKGNYLNVGLGREDDRHLADHVAAYVTTLTQQGRIPPLSPTKWKGHAYLVYPHSPRPLVDEAALLVGDAAGMAYFPSGEGIRPAVESGLIAAEVLAAAAGDYQRSRLEPYQARVLARFGKKATHSLGDLLPLGLKRRVASKLMAWGWFSRHVLLDRWFLRAHEPALRLEHHANGT